MTANEYAIKHGYKGAKFLHYWRGFKCYEPVLGKGVDGAVGLPLVILEKYGDVHISTPEEALSHFDEMVLGGKANG